MAPVLQKILKKVFAALFPSFQSRQPEDSAYYVRASAISRKYDTPK